MCIVLGTFAAGMSAPIWGPPVAGGLVTTGATTAASTLTAAGTRIGARIVAATTAASAWINHVMRRSTGGGGNWWTS